MQPAPEQADVVVIGGGVIGASVAFHLAEAGIATVLVEGEALGSGSSAKPRGGLRAQFSDALNVALGASSLEAYRRFGADHGTDIDQQEVGYLFVLRDPEAVAIFERTTALQQELGLANRLVDPAEAHALCPYLDQADVLAAAFSPGDGHALPAEVIAGYVGSARRHGAVVLDHCPVTAIDVSGGEITAVQTARGTIRTSTVVCTAGAWSGKVAALAGVELPVEPLRRQIAFTPALEPAPPTIPFTIDFRTTFYAHNAGDGLLLGMSDPAEPVGFQRDYDGGWLPGLRAAAARAVPGLPAHELTHGWAGLYEMTPDANAVIGESRAVGRFLYATGYSGHGFVQAPATGAVVRDLVRGTAPFVDVTPLRAERFAERAPIAEANIV